MKYKKGIRLLALCMALIFVLDMSGIRSIAATPTDADPEYSPEEWEDEEKREEAWMVYCITDWPIKQLAVGLSKDGEAHFSFREDEDQWKSVNELYKKYVDSFFDMMEGTEADCAYEPIDYKDILYYMIMKLNQMTLRGFGDFVYDYSVDPDAEYEKDFEFSTSFTDNDKDEKGRLALNKYHYHDINDIAFVSVFINKDYTPPSGLTDDQKKVDSIRQLFNALIKAEKSKDPMSAEMTGDIFKSDNRLAGMLLRVCCPEYKYSTFCMDWFQDHMAKLCYERRDEIKNGTLYPWIHELGYTNRELIKGSFSNSKDLDEGFIAYNFDMVPNYGDSEDENGERKPDGIVDDYISRDFMDPFDAYATSKYDPSCFWEVKEEYTAGTIEMLDYDEWGIHINFDNYDVNPEYDENDNEGVDE